MRPSAFALLYLACLAACLGAVLALEVGWTRPARPVVQVEAELLAVPPKPEGARPPSPGSGDGRRIAEADCRELSGDLRDGCHHALALQRAERDPEGALAACRQVADPAVTGECMADVAELVAPGDRGRAEAICPGIRRRKWRDQCWFGIALAWAKQDFDYARSTCERSGMWADFCRHDVNGTISTLDPGGALAFCEAQDGPLLRRKSCYHGLGKYLGRQDPGRALATCLQVPTTEPLYRENCFHGIGWAIAEGSEERAVAWCRERAGRWTDSCLMGVSAHAKRLDRSAAAAICRELRRADLRARCESFAER